MATPVYAIVPLGHMSAYVVRVTRMSITISSPVASARFALVARRHPCKHGVVRFYIHRSCLPVQRHLEYHPPVRRGLPVIDLWFAHCAKPIPFERPVTRASRCCYHGSFFHHGFPASLVALRPRVRRCYSASRSCATRIRRTALLSRYVIEQHLNF